LNLECCAIELEELKEKNEGKGIEEGSDANYKA
jgi:hypothetical protein